MIFKFIQNVASWVKTETILEEDFAFSIWRGRNTAPTKKLCVKILFLFFKLSLAYVYIFSIPGVGAQFIWWLKKTENTRPGMKNNCILHTYFSAHAAHNSRNLPNKYYAPTTRHMYIICRSCIPELLKWSCSMSNNNRSFCDKKCLQIIPTLIRLNKKPPLVSQ